MFSGKGKCLGCWVSPMSSKFHSSNGGIGFWNGSYLNSIAGKDSKPLWLAGLQGEDQPDQHLLYAQHDCSGCRPPSLPDEEQELPINR
ncbi:hypothetical protein GOP47_0029952 [Adiantum capillus-veneris]|nr:hypothetical protein GOP47_0029952 [Adiantum capillus-veneris]